MNVHSLDTLLGSHRHWDKNCFYFWWLRFKKLLEAFLRDVIGSCHYDSITQLLPVCGAHVLLMKKFTNWTPHMKRCSATALWPSHDAQVGLRSSESAMTAPLSSITAAVASFFNTKQDRWASCCLHAIAPNSDAFFSIYPVLVNSSFSFFQEAFQLLSIKKYLQNSTYSSFTFVGIINSCFTSELYTEYPGKTKWINPPWNTCSLKNKTKRKAWKLKQCMKQLMQPV